MLLPKTEQFAHISIETFDFNIFVNNKLTSSSHVKAKQNKNPFSKNASVNPGFVQGKEIQDTLN